MGLKLSLLTIFNELSTTFHGLPQQIKFAQLSGLIVTILKYAVGFV